MRHGADEYVACMVVVLMCFRFLARDVARGLACVNRRGAESFDGMNLKGFYRFGDQHVLQRFCYHVCMYSICSFHNLHQWEEEISKTWLWALPAQCNTLLPELETCLLFPPQTPNDAYQQYDVQ